MVLGSTAPANLTRLLAEWFAVHLTIDRDTRNDGMSTVVRTSCRARFVRNSHWVLTATLAGAKVAIGQSGRLRQLRRRHIGSGKR